MHVYLTDRCVEWYTPGYSMRISHLDLFLIVYLKFANSETDCYLDFSDFVESLKLIYVQILRPAPQRET